MSHLAVSEDVEAMLEHLHCPVCFEPKLSSTVCGNGHSVCDGCIGKWSGQKACPACRQPWLSKPVPNVQSNALLMQLGVKREAPPPPTAAPPRRPFTTDPRPVDGAAFPNRHATDLLGMVARQQLPREQRIQQAQLTAREKKNFQARLRREYVRLSNVVTRIRQGGTPDEQRRKFLARDTTLIKIMQDQNMFTDRFGVAYRPANRDFERVYSDNLHHVANIVEL
jgi:hypothetical protein